MISEALKLIAIGTIILIVRMMRSVVSGTSILIVCPPFPSSRNIGDRALCIGAISAIRRQTDTSIVFVQSSNEDIPPFEGHENVTILSGMQNLLIFGGSFLEKVKWLVFLRHASELYLIGADSLDESYSAAQSAGKLATAGLASRTGIPTSLISFSVNKVTPEFKFNLEALPKSVRLVPRDPVSLRRLKAAEVKRDNIDQGADLSFLVLPAEEVPREPYSSFFAAHRGRIVGINFNNQMFPNGVVREVRLEYLADSFASFASKENVAIVLLPNTFLLKDLYMSQLQAMLVARGCSCGLIDPVPECSEYKAILEQCEYVFTVSLHLFLFSLSVGVPGTCFPYVGKFAGVLEEFEISDSLIDLDALPASSAEFSRTMSGHYALRSGRRENIVRNLPRIKELALNNFDLKFERPNV